jgi:hypothetical protein
MTTKEAKNLTYAICTIMVLASVFAYFGYANALRDTYTYEVPDVCNRISSDPIVFICE